MKKHLVKPDVFACRCLPCLMYMLHSPFISGEDFTAAAQCISSISVLETNADGEPSSLVNSFENDG